MTFLLSILARWGVPERFRKALAIALAVVALVALLAILKGCYDRNVVNQHEAEREAKAADARETAAAERMADQIDNAEQEDRRNDAINQATDSPLSDADHRLNCQRLRDLGRIPAGC